MQIRTVCCLTALCLSFLGATITSASATTASRYEQTNLVSNLPKFNPQIIDDKFINGWGIANRPKGAGGHIWVAGKDTSFQYVGDVHASTDEKLQKLFVDDLPYVKVPVSGPDNFATGIVFSASKDQFVITQSVPDAEPISQPAKFIFAADSGIISAWTERKKADNSFDRPTDAIPVIDHSKEGAQYFGLAISANYDRLYAANFGVAPGIQVFNGKFQPEEIKFDNPFDTNKNGIVDAGEYAPFNVQAIALANGEKRIFVAYAKTQLCPAEEVAKGTCETGKIFAGEEDTSKPGQGRLAEFTEDGKLVTVWQDKGKLSAPWGIALAPQNFGTLSGKLLVANFGDGTIAAFDPKTHAFAHYMLDTKGKTVKIDKIWGLLFGNGESLGDGNALYFSAGPNDEKEGLFGSLRLE